MTWGEAVRLVTVLNGDPSSHVAAAIAGWDHPVDRATLVAMDAYDLAHKKAAGRRAKPYPRPWDKLRRTMGRGTRLTIDQLRAKLDAHRRSGAIDESETVLGGRD